MPKTLSPSAIPGEAEVQRCGTRPTRNAEDAACDQAATGNSRDAVVENQPRKDQIKIHFPPSQSLLEATTTPGEPDSIEKCLHGFSQINCRGPDILKHPLRPHHNRGRKGWATLIIFHLLFVVHCRGLGLLAFRVGSVGSHRAALSILRHNDFSRRHHLAVFLHRQLHGVGIDLFVGPHV